MKYSVLQAKIEELNLNDLINEQFIQKIPGWKFMIPLLN